MATDFVAGPTGPHPDDPHPPPDRLAALADEAPTVVEERHLSACPVCASEVESYRSLLALTRAERDRLGEPLTNWESLGSALSREGLLATPADRGRLSRPLPRLHGWARRTAAALVLVSSGVAVGRISVRLSGPITGGPTPSAATSSVDVQSSSGNTKAPLASDNSGNRAQFTTNPKFASTDDALAAVVNAETAYRHAVAYLMVTDSADKGAGIPNDYRTRLATLDEVARTTRAALFAAPNDPVLRRVYLNSVDARDATLRELGQTIPASLQGGQY
jgi:hypothetical protein